MGMLNQTNGVPRPAGEMNGDLSGLEARLASCELGELTRAGTTLDLGPIQTRGDLYLFLRRYVGEVLIPRDLPVICRAFGHASRSEARELVALDQWLREQPGAEVLGRASGHAGRGQLRRLRPVRDQRVVQRYLAAVDAGQATGWHTIVYGLFIALFSVPLRQGAVHYANQTLNAFVESAAGPLRLTQAECAAFVEERLDGVPAAVDSLLEREWGPVLRVT